MSSHIDQSFSVFCFKTLLRFFSPLLGKCLSLAHLFPLSMAHVWVRHINLATKIWFLWRMWPCATEIFISVAHQKYMRHRSRCATEEDHAPQKSYIHVPQKYIINTK